VTGQAGNSVGTAAPDGRAGWESQLVSIDIQLQDNAQCTTLAGSSLNAMSCAP
jgi:hypothetical protein